MAYLLLHARIMRYVRAEARYMLRAGELYASVHLVDDINVIKICLVAASLVLQVASLDSISGAADGKFMPYSERFIFTMH